MRIFMRRTKGTGFNGVQGNPQLHNTHSVSGIVTAATREISDDKDTSRALPILDDVEVNIDPNDVKVDVYRASGNGGQCVNTTDSAVWLTHLPTGIVVTCQDEKSQIKNRAKAMTVQKARIYDKMQQEQTARIAAERKDQVGSGDRNERIRTYNFPQSRVTDHRIGLTLYKLDQIMDGDLDEIIDALITDDQAKKMAIDGYFISWNK